MPRELPASPARGTGVLSQGTGHTPRVTAPALGAAIVTLCCRSELSGSISSPAGKPFALHKSSGASGFLLDFLEPRSPAEGDTCPMGRLGSRAAPRC